MFPYACVWLCLHFQQRAPGSQGVLKEEKLPPSPLMRGEPLNPAMRPDHHKHPDNKPSQPGHSQQSTYKDLFIPQRFILFLLSFYKKHNIEVMFFVCNFVAQMWNPWTAHGLSFAPLSPVDLPPPFKKKRSSSRSPKRLLPPKRYRGL